MYRTLLAAACAAALSTFPATAHDYAQGGLSIAHPNMPQPLRAGGSAAGYLTITNTSDAADRLLAIESDFATSTELHTTEHGSDGVARMSHVPELEIPAGESAEFAPGGLHVMFMGITERPEIGARVPAVMVFETAGRMEVEFAVEDRAEANDHSAHGSHGAHAGH